MRPGVRVIAVGLASIAILFALYARYATDASMIAPDALEPLQRMAHAFYALLLAALACVAWGMYTFHRAMARDGTNGALARIALVTWARRPRMVFVITLVVYGTFFSLTSGTLVHQPDVSFSYHYGAQIPSIEVAPCCDVPGYMPKAIIYVTDNVGLQVIPVNLVLQVAVSYLVALNMSIASVALSASRARRSVSGVGAITGLFVACPTCAGSVASAVLGTASGITLAVALSQVQTGLIAVSIPVLLVTPLLLARRIPRRSEQC